MAAVAVYAPLVAVVAEATYVEHGWQALCATAKTQVKRQVIIEGFYDDGFRIHGWGVLAGGRNGFRFVEWKDKDGRIRRTEGFNESAQKTVQIERPTARDHWRRNEFPTPVGHLLARREETIVDTETGEVIAQSISGYRYPSFADRLWRQWLDNVPTECGSKRDIWSETLIGIDRKQEAK